MDELWLWDRESLSPLLVAVSAVFKQPWLLLGSLCRMRRIE